MTIASEVPMKFRLIGYCICATLATTGATAAERTSGTGVAKSRGRAPSISGRRRLEGAMSSCR